MYALLSPQRHNACMSLHRHLQDLWTRLPQQQGVLVLVHRTLGSVPREAGTWMVVWPDGHLTGTIGGGQLEYQAMERAQALLSGLPDAPPGGEEHRYPLGPSLGQCCGGVVFLRFEIIDASQIDALRQRLQAALPPVAIFGGGHVGEALVSLLSTLPCNLHWIDSRDSVFPDTTPAHVRTEHSEPVQGAVAGLAPQSRVLIMSFSHAEDLDILIACVQRQRQAGDLPYIGLIGSKTKWAKFRHRLQARGFSDAEIAHVTCPIGLPDISGKEPEVIAVAVAAQLLQQGLLASSRD